MDGSLIGASIHCPLCGSDRYEFADPGRRCGACGHSDFNNPIVAVAGYVFDAEDRVLLIRRAKDPGKGLLAPPGGFVDAGETLESALEREVLEEVNLRITGIRYLSSHPNNYVYRGLARPVCDVFFTARAAETAVASPGVEATEVTWLQRESIDPLQLAFDSMRRAFALL